MVSLVLGTLISEVHFFADGFNPEKYPAMPQSNEETQHLYPNVSRGLIALLFSVLAWISINHF
jgi:hypothetical protein